MSLVARRQLRTQAGRVYARRIIGTTSIPLTIDTIIGGEARSALPVDAFITLEDQSQETLDLLSRPENQGILVADLNLRTEESVSQTLDAILETETLARGVLDLFPVIEASHGIASDIVSRLESSGATQASSRIQTVFGNALISASNLNLEAQGLIIYFVDTFTQLEFQANLHSDSFVRSEELSRETSDLLARTEAQASITVTVDTTIPFEALERFLTDSAIPLESPMGMRADTLATTEMLGAASVPATVRTILEYRGRVQADATPVIETGGALQADLGISTESHFNITVTARDRLEARASVVSVADSIVPVETRGQITQDIFFPAEASTLLVTPLRTQAEFLFTVLQSARTRLEIQGLATISLDGFFNLETLQRDTSDTQAPTESAARESRDVLASLATQQRLSASSRVAAEFLAILLADKRVNLEAGGRLLTTVDVLVNLEVAGTSIGFDTPILVLESGVVLRVDAIVPAEYKAILSIPQDPSVDIGLQLEQGIPSFGPQNNLLSIGRVRILTVPYTALQVEPFDPIRPGEIDNFAFDFTLQAGAATIVSSAWTCSLAPGSLGDDVSQARIIRQEPFTTVYTQSPLDNTIQAWTGAFAVALIGTFPVEAIGATFLLAATVTLGDGRILTAEASVLCTS